jgi:hypothetical protein
MNVIGECKRTWRRLGVPAEAAAEMAAELEDDLAKAAAEGREPEEYVGADARLFAREWASARGLVRARLRLVTTIGAAVVGALPGAAFALFAAYGLSSPAIGDMFGSPVRVGENAYQNYFEAPVWLILPLYVLGALFACGGALAGASAVLAWRLDPIRASTRRLLVAALPLGTGAAVAATILFASTQRFGTTASVVLADAFVAVAVFALFVGGARVLAVGRWVEGGGEDVLQSSA